MGSKNYREGNTCGSVSDAAPTVFGLYVLPPRSGAVILQVIYFSKSRSEGFVQQPDNYVPHAQAFVRTAMFAATAASV